MTTVDMDKVRPYMRCDIQDGEGPYTGAVRMCGTCWRAANEDLTADELEALVKHYPPAAAADTFFGRA